MDDAEPLGARHLHPRSIAQLMHGSEVARFGSLMSPKLCMEMLMACSKRNSLRKLHAHVTQVLVTKTVLNLMTAIWSSHGLRFCIGELKTVCTCTEMAKESS